MLGRAAIVTPPSTRRGAVSRHPTDFPRHTHPAAACMQSLRALPCVEVRRRENTLSGDKTVWRVCDERDRQLTRIVNSDCYILVIASVMSLSLLRVLVTSTAHVIRPYDVVKVMQSPADLRALRLTATITSSTYRKGYNCEWSGSCCMHMDDTYGLALVASGGLQNGSTCHVFHFSHAASFVHTHMATRQDKLFAFSKEHNYSRSN
jgi:hypothetical protein